MYSNRLLTLPTEYTRHLRAHNVPEDTINSADILFNVIQKFMTYTDSLALEFHIPNRNNFAITRKLLTQNEQTYLVISYIHHYLSLKEAYNVELPATYTF